MKHIILTYLNILDLEKNKIDNTYIINIIKLEIK